MKTLTDDELLPLFAKLLPETDKAQFNIFVIDDIKYVTADFARKIELRAKEWEAMAGELYEHSDHLPFCNNIRFKIENECTCGFADLKYQYTQLK